MQFEKYHNLNEGYNPLNWENTPTPTNPNAYSPTANVPKDKFDWAGTLGAVADIFSTVSSATNRPTELTDVMSAVEREKARIENEKKSKNMKNAYWLIGISSVVVIGVVGFVIYATKKSKK